MKKNLNNFRQYFEDLPKPRGKKVELPPIGDNLKELWDHLRYYGVHLLAFFYLVYLKSFIFIKPTLKKLKAKLKRPLSVQEAIILILLTLLIVALMRPNHTIGLTPPPKIKVPVKLSMVAETKLQPQNEAEAVVIPEVGAISSPSIIPNFANNYAFGNCTWYVASVLHVPDSWGNANTWDDGARDMGKQVLSSPRVGAIAQTDYGWAGHVAVVTSINPDGSFMVREMNYNGFDLVDDRLATLADFQHFIVL